MALESKNIKVNTVEKLKQVIQDNIENYIVNIEIQIESEDPKHDE
ncbi:MAG: hypothetical protein SO150_03450 [Faecalicoccus sp.]|nr:MULTISPECIES: hypothetical protein [Faecalicoccus]MDY4869382.1 hypothetical protein [Faecalicoccus sp.]MDY5232743.1 hypothetical protein [Faecalicoccus sp.]